MSPFVMVGIHGMVCSVWGDVIMTAFSSSIVQIFTIALLLMTCKLSIEKCLHTHNTQQTCNVKGGGAPGCDVMRGRATL